MGVATSSYQNNNYQIARTRPYQLPINDIFKAISSQNQFWIDGARNVKNAYNSALNLDLTLEENREVRRQFMEDSEKQLTKLSSMDVSDPSVQRKGIGIFKPLLRDKSIILDDTLTKMRGSLISEAETFKMKDKGKGYSDVNLGYALDGFENFHSKATRGSLESLYEKVKNNQYVPFYDPADDIDKAMKYCKPSTSPHYNEGEMTGYSKKELSSVQVKACFEAGLSDKAKRQLDISGYMSFKNHPEVLAGEYIKYNNTSLKGYNQYISELSTDIATIENKNKEGKATPEEIQQLELLVKEKKSYTDQIVKLTGLNNKLSIGDYSPLDDDYEGIAGLVYRDLRTSEFGRAFKSQEFIADPVSMLHIRQTFEAAQQEDDQLFEAQQLQEKLKAEYTLAQLKGGASEVPGARFNPITGKYEFSDIIPISRKDEEPVKEAYSEFTKEVTKVNADIFKNNEYTAAMLLEENNGYIKEHGDIDIDVTLGGGKQSMKISDYLKAVKNRRIISRDLIKEIPNLRDFLTKNAELNPKFGEILFDNFTYNTSKKSLDAIATLKEAQISQDLRSGLSNPEIAKLSPTTVDVGGRSIAITPYDVQAALEGRQNPAGLTITKSARPTSMILSGGTSFTPETPITFAVGGIPIDTFSTNKSLDKLYRKVISVDEKRITNLNAKRQELYGDRSWKEEPFYKVYSGDKNSIITKFEEGVESKISTKDNKVDITVDALDYQGGTKVIIPGYDEGDKDEIVRATNADANNSYYNEKEGAWYLSKVPDMNFSDRLGVTPDIRNLGITLNRVAASLPRGTYGTVGEPMEIPVVIAGKYQTHTLTFENGNKGIEFILKNPDGKIMRSTNAFDMAQKIQGLRR